MCHFSAVYYSLHSLELGLVVVALLCMLHRILQFSFRGASSRRWTAAARGFFAAGMAGILIAFCSNVVAAVYFSRAAGSNSAAIAFLDQKDSAKASEYEVQANERTAEAVHVASFSRFSESSVLLMLISAFCIVGAKFYKIIAAGLTRLAAEEHKFAATVKLRTKFSDQLQLQQFSEFALQGRALLQKVVWTFVFVFVSVLVRCFFHLFYAVAQFNQDYANPCSPSQCHPCKNVRLPVRCCARVYTP
jgi:hypothetical protein